MKLRKTILMITSIGILTTCGIAAYAWKEENRPKLLEIHALNLKSNVSFFLRTPDDRRIIIDGGVNSEIVRSVTKILPFYSRRIDSLILTSNSAKNASGFIDILKRYDVGEVYMPAVTLQSIGLSTSSDQIYDSFLDLLKEKGIEPKMIKEGDRLKFDDTVNANVIFPAEERNFQYSKASAPELMLKIKHADNVFTLIGHATLKIQKYLVVEAERSDLLFIANNASPDNIDASLMDKVHPKYLIYSKSLTATTRTPAGNDGKKKKEKSDPLYYLPQENRFNIKEYEYVRIESDGKGIRLFPHP